ncbi:UDP-glycosyltransferase 91C1 [Senna tora]|uniref:UDP-glycosyltransferase 91C1 n=1 Tax=Senna tora TaxID=362788 RepID=A0A834TYC2_9FABA|nr:UDP-glycosyltransferase 91C1 [Senna tora]
MPRTPPCLSSAGPTNPSPTATCRSSPPPSRCRRMLCWVVDPPVEPVSGKCSPTLGSTRVRTRSNSELLLYRNFLYPHPCDPRRRHQKVLRFLPDRVGTHQTRRGPEESHSGSSFLEEGYNVVGNIGGGLSVIGEIVYWLRLAPLPVGFVTGSVARWLRNWLRLAPLPVGSATGSVWLRCRLAPQLALFDSVAGWLRNWLCCPLAPQLALLPVSSATGFVWLRCRLALQLALLPVGSATGSVWLHCRLAPQLALFGSVAGWLRNWLCCPLAPQLGSTSAFSYVIARTCFGGFVFRSSSLSLSIRNAQLYGSVRQLYVK